MDKKNDVIKELFSKLPDDKLQPSFRMNVMLEVTKEARRMRRRNERWAMIATISTALLLIGIAVVAIWYADDSLLLTLQQTFISLKRVGDNSEIFGFYSFIAFLAICLLFMDYKVRRFYARNKEEKLEG
ncbi:MAG: hypothetical protein ACRC3Z_08860 [Phocaeicola sp.]